MKLNLLDISHRNLEVCVEIVYDNLEKDIMFCVWINLTIEKILVWGRISIRNEV